MPLSQTSRKKIRVIVRPWSPRRAKEIDMEVIKQRITEIYPLLQEVLYMGWIRRKVNGVKGVLFLGATGKTSAEARKRFKTSEEFDKEIWNLGYPNSKL